MPLIQLSIETRTLHAELMERLGVREAQRSIGSLDGTFVTKTISGKEYLYFYHYTPGGGRRTICAGQKSPKLVELVAQHQEGRRDDREDPIGIRELCAQLKAGRISEVEKRIKRTPPVIELDVKDAKGKTERRGRQKKSSAYFELIGELVSIEKLGQIPAFRAMHDELSGTLQRLGYIR